MRKKLSDILHTGDQDRLKKAWSETKAAEDLVPIPSGVYVAKLVDASMHTSKRKGTPGFKLVFETIEGEHAGRKLWHDIWLTENAIPMAKKDLAKFGISSLDQLDQPLPATFICKVNVALRREDDGIEWNRVRAFEVLRTEKLENDPFAPDDNPDAEPDADVDTSFDPQSSQTSFLAKDSGQGPYQR